MESADDLIMQEGGVSDLDRAKRIINKQQAEIERLRDSVEFAWGIIANATGGDWANQTKEWQAAAMRFLDNDRRRVYESRLRAEGVEDE